ncbi:MAG: hypothetical protein WC813_00365 [Patescibacteria group bacterium]|jgi:hypothetical protein
MKKMLLGMFGSVIGILLLTQNAFALTVSPVKLETIGDPGKTITGEIILLNEEDKEITYYSSFERFDAEGESGNPVFSKVTEGLPTWITIRDSVTLGPHERLTVPYTVEIPNDAAPGGNFAAIFWNTVPPDELNTGEVALGAKVGILMLLRISGDILEGGNLLEFGIKHNQTFFTAPPVDFWYRFKNTGIDRVKPSGTVTIRNTFGLKTTEFNANPTDGNVLPDSIRRLTTYWNEKDSQGSEIKYPEELSFASQVKYELTHFHLGRFTAKLHLEYGTDGKTTDAKVSFWMIPWHALILIISALFVALVLGIIFITRYNRWIIKRAHAKTQV